MNCKEEWEEWYLSEYPEDDPCAPFPGEFMEWDFEMIQNFINEAGKEDQTQENTEKEAND